MKSTEYDTDRLKRFDGHEVVCTDESHELGLMFGQLAYLRIWKSGMVFQSPVFKWDDRARPETTEKMQRWFDEVYQKVFGPPKPEPEEIVEYIPRKFEP